MNFKTSIIAIIFLFFYFLSFAQKKEYIPIEESNKFSAVLISGLGGFIKGDAGAGGGLAIQYKQKEHFFELHVIGFSELSLFNSYYHIGTDAAAMYGLSKRKNKWIYMAGVGLGYYAYTFKENIGGGLFSSNTSPNYIKSTQSTIGFPIMASVIRQRKKFGLGLQVNGNFNSLQTYGMIGMCIKYQF
jgi:hypothetical protein